MKELWKDIKEYVGRYQVSNFGRVRNIVTGKILKIRIGTPGYYIVGLSKNAINKNYFIHRLLGFAFLKNHSKIRNDINHKDCNKLNNNLDNLEWCTRSENLIHASRNGLLNPHHVGLTGSLSPYAKKIKKISKNGSVLKIYNSIVDAAKDLGAYKSSICKALRGYSKSSHGYRWEYV